MDSNLILVYYIGTGLVDDENVDQYIKLVMDKIKSELSVVGEIIIVPTKDIDTRIECINPKYITDAELIREHRLKMDELHEHLTHHITSLKNKEEDGRKLT